MSDALSELLDSLDDSNDPTPKAIQVKRTPRKRGALGQIGDAIARQWSESTEGGFGFSKETNHFLQRDVQHPLKHVNEIIYKPVEGAYAGLQAIMAGVEAAARGADKASEVSGAADALATSGGKFLPGSAAMALMEAFPAGAEGVGMIRASQSTTYKALKSASRPVKLRVAAHVAEDVSESGVPFIDASVAQKATGKVDLSIPKVKPRALPKGKPAVAAMEHEVDVPTLKSAPLVHEGELLSADELLGDPHTARALVTERLGKLTDEQTAHISARITQAMESGDVVDDPFFRSLLKIDTTDVAKDPQKLLHVLEVFDDSLDDMLTKAGAGHRTVGQMTDGFQKLKAKGVTLDDLMKNAADTEDLYAKARIGTHAVTLAGHEFVKARELLLPRIIAKEAGAREALVDRLVSAAQTYAVGRAPLSNAARAMRFSQVELPLGLAKMTDEVAELPDPTLIERRVRDAMEKLNDEDITDLAMRINTGSDLKRIEAVISDPHAAEQFSRLHKARVMMEKFLKSNALSPATGLYNAASLVLHDFFRSDLARTKAIRNMIHSGDLDTAELFRLERMAGRAVYWEAHKRGIAAMVDRIRWEFWTDVENISSVGWGSGKVTAAARRVRSEMEGRGYTVPILREQESRTWMSMNKGSAADFNARLKAQAGDGGAFARVLAAVERADTVATNTVEALGTASAKLFIGAFDDWGREFVRMKELHVQSTRMAFREGLAEGLTGEDLADFVKDRAKELAEIPTSSVLDAVETALMEGTELPVETRMLLQRERQMDEEADKVLFMDGPQTSFGQKSAELLSHDPGFIFPYVRTPIRLFEAGLIDYTPAGKFAKHMRETLEAGGPEAELTKARMELGLTAIGIGFGMGLSGTLVVTNGGFENTAGLGAGPPNRLQIGDAYVEIGRLDPFSLTVALGGFLGQAAREGFATGAEYDANEGMRAATATILWGVNDAILSKSYLTGLRDVVTTLSTSDEGRAQAGVEKVLNSTLIRMVPLAGTQKQINETVRGTTPEVVTATDSILRHIAGAGIFLPVKRDILGNPLDARVVGTAAGLSSPVDDVAEILRDLKIDLQAIRRTDPTGFRLNAEQLDELRRLRGHEAIGPQGLSLREELRELFADEEFQSMGTREAKQRAVASVISSFNEPARELLEERDPKFAANREGNRSFIDYIEQGLSRSEARDAATEDTVDAGLVEPELR